MTWGKDKKKWIDCVGAAFILLTSLIVGVVFYLFENGMEILSRSLIILRNESDARKRLRRRLGHTSIYRWSRDRNVASFLFLLFFVFFRGLFGFRDQTLEILRGLCGDRVVEGCISGLIAR